MPKVSIIIPVYNAEKYINKCIDSILSQTLDDFEIILVDDGSTDSTVHILEDYAAKDNRIKIFKQQNQGQGCARNKGIAEAIGEYIYFADQDDWIDSELFEAAYNKARIFGADIVEIFHIYECGAKSRMHTMNFKLPVDKSFDYKVDKRYLLGTSFAGWSRFIKRELINNAKIRFSECRSLEDYIYTIKAKLNAKKIITIKNPNYHYVIRGNSDLNTTRSYKIESVDALLEVKQLLIEYNIFESYKKEFIKLSINSLVTIEKCIPAEMREQFLQKCKQLLEDDYGKYLKYLKYNNRSRIQRIFDLRNEFEDNKKKKVCTILGKDFIVCDNLENPTGILKYILRIKYKKNVLPRVLVHFHLYYHDQIDYYIEKMKNIVDCDWDLYVTYVEKNEESEKKILGLKPDAKLVLVENRGYDVWPFIQIMKSVNLDEYDYVLKIHTKNQRERQRFKHIVRKGFWWRNELIDTLLKNPHRFSKILKILKNKDVGMVFSKFLFWDSKIMHKEYQVMLEEELQRLNIKTKHRNWCAGTMFIARANVFNFLNSDLINKDLYSQEMHTGSDATKAHVYEGIFGMLVSEAGLNMRTIVNNPSDAIIELFKAYIQPIAEWFFALKKENNIKFIVILGCRFNYMEGK